jgi:hypothetical protein
MTGYIGGITMKINKNIVLSFIVLGFFAVLWFALTYYRLPLGDDVLTQHSTAINVYLDNSNKSIGILITSLSQIWGKMAYEYHVWNGRVLGVLMEPMLTLFGQGFTAIISVAIYSGIVISCGILAYGSLKGILTKPIAIFVLAIMLFWYNAAMGFMSMWVMTCIYGMTMLMYLLYLVALNKVISTRFSVNFKWIVLLNVFGFLVGITHEALGAICIMVILTRTLVSVYRQKAGIRKFFIHSGLLVGYLVTFFAPGNFNRMLQNHDSQQLAISLVQRLRMSFQAHSIVLNGTNKLTTILLTIMIFLFISTLMPITKEKMKNLMVDNIEYMVGIIASIFIWSTVSYTPVYGTVLWLAFVLIFLLRNINVDEKLTRFGFVLIISAFLMISTAKHELPWMNSMRVTTNQWRTSIALAKSQGLKEVKVPAYPAITNNLYTLKNFLNNQINYDRDYYLSYYGIHIIVDQGK